jgi:hypothetical protein
MKRPNFRRRERKEMAFASVNARPGIPGSSLAVRKPVEQYGGTGRRLARRERREAAPEAGSAGREA